MNPHTGSRGESCCRKWGRADDRNTLARPAIAGGCGVLDRAEPSARALSGADADGHRIVLHSLPHSLCAIRTRVVRDPSASHPGRVGALWIDSR